MIPTRGEQVPSRACSPLWFQSESVNAQLGFGRSCYATGCWDSCSQRRVGACWPVSLDVAVVADIEVFVSIEDVRGLLVTGENRETPWLWGLDDPRRLEGSPRPTLPERDRHARFTTSARLRELVGSSQR